MLVKNAIHRTDTELAVRWLRAWWPDGSGVDQLHLDVSAVANRAVGLFARRAEPLAHNSGGATRHPVARPLAGSANQPSGVLTPRQRFGCCFLGLKPLSPLRPSL